MIEVLFVDIYGFVEGVIMISDQMGVLCDVFDYVWVVFEEIFVIVCQIYLFVLNVVIEVVCVGELGCSFVVVVVEVKNLFVKIGQVMVQIEMIFVWFVEQIEYLFVEGIDNVVCVYCVCEGMCMIGEVVYVIGYVIIEFVGEVEQIVLLMDEIEMQCYCFDEQVGEMVFGVENLVENFLQVKDWFGNLFFVFEMLIEFIVVIGIELFDMCLIDVVCSMVVVIGKFFEEVVGCGDIMFDVFFDMYYELIFGIDLQQFMMCFIVFIDCVLLVVQELVFDFDECIVYCVSFDWQCYLLIYNWKFLLFQCVDVVWNVVYCWNCWIYMDWMVCMLVLYDKLFLLQIYCCDMGNGQFVLMKDVFVLIVVGGWLWGVLRIGYSV